MDDPCPDATMRTVRSLSPQSRWTKDPDSELWTTSVSGKRKMSRVRSRQYDLYHHWTTGVCVEMLVYWHGKTTDWNSIAKRRSSRTDTCTASHLDTSERQKKKTAENDEHNKRFETCNTHDSYRFSTAQCVRVKPVKTAVRFNIKMIFTTSFSSYVSQTVKSVTDVGQLQSYVTFSVQTWKINSQRMHYQYILDPLLKV